MADCRNLPTFHGRGHRQLSSWWRGSSSEPAKGLDRDSLVSSGYPNGQTPSHIGNGLLRSSQTVSDEFAAAFASVGWRVEAQ